MPPKIVVLRIYLFTYKVNTAKVFKCICLFLRRIFCLNRRRIDSRLYCVLTFLRQVLKIKLFSVKLFVIYVYQRGK